MFGYYVMCLIQILLGIVIDGVAFAVSIQILTKAIIKAMEMLTGRKCN